MTMHLHMTETLMTILQLISVLKNNDKMATPTEKLTRKGCKRQRKLTQLEIAKKLSESLFLIICYFTPQEADFVYTKGCLLDILC